MTAQEWINEVETYVDGVGQGGGGSPPLPIFFIRFAHLMLNSFEISSERAKVFGIAISFLTTGLQLHMRGEHRPMDVLLGDLLSMQFYRLLSEQGEVEAIKRLSQTISHMNEKKMEHYLWLQKKVLWDKEALVRMQFISSALLLTVADFLRAEDTLEGKKGWAYMIPRAFLLNEVGSCNPELTKDGEGLVCKAEAELRKGIASVESVAVRKGFHLLMEPCLPVCVRG